MKAEAEEGEAPEKEPAQRNGLPGVFEAGGGDKEAGEAEKATGEQRTDAAGAPVKKPAGEGPQSAGAEDGAKMDVDTEPKADTTDGMDVDKENAPKE